MSPLEGFLIIAAVLAASGAGTVALVRRARAAGALIDQILHEPGTQVWDDDAHCWLTLPDGTLPGPSQYTVRDVAALDDLVLAWQAPAFDPATDPQWAAGRARLLADLNNDQQGEL
jgi:hypothetical protein